MIRRTQMIVTITCDKCGRHVAKGLSPVDAARCAFNAGWSLAAGFQACYACSVKVEQTPAPFDVAANQQLLDEDGHVVGRTLGEAKKGQPMTLHVRTTPPMGAEPLLLGGIFYQLPAGDINKTSWNPEVKTRDTQSAEKADEK